MALSYDSAIFLCVAIAALIGDLPIDAPAPQNERPTHINRGGPGKNGRMIKPAARPGQTAPSAGTAGRFSQWGPTR